jgi:hypothetical protein
MRTDRRLAAAVFAAALLAYLAPGGFLPGEDATPNVLLGAALVDEGRLFLSPGRDPQAFAWSLRTPRGEISGRVTSLDDRLGGATAGELWARGDLVPRAPYYLVEARPGPEGAPRFVSTFGPVPAVAAAPVLLLARAGGPLSESPGRLWFVQKLAASILAAGAAAATFLASRRLASRGAALLLAAAVGLGTSLWSMTSQALWQSAPNAFFLAAGSLFLLGAPERRRDALLAGLFLAAASACRPTSALLAAAGAVALVARPRALLAFALGALPVVLARAAHDLHFFGTPLELGQLVAAGAVARLKTGSPDPWQTPLAEGLAGVLFSPSRGLLVFSPLLALGLAGAVAAVRRGRPAPLKALAAGVVAVTLVEARWFDWWGGWSYGPRRLSDLAPLLAVLAAPLMAWALAARWRRVAVAGLLCWSIALQVLGAFAYDVEGWNGQPDVDRPENRARLWAVADGQVVWYLSHLGEARAHRRALERRWLARWEQPPRD